MIERVELNGMELFLVDGGPLALPEHIKDGELTWEGFVELSYAFLYPDGCISRYGTEIGTKDDLIFLDKVPTDAEVKS